MQITHETNGECLQEYPVSVPVKDVNVYRHDSGMMVNHDYSCPCCRENHAVLNLSNGVMMPCRKCDKDYALIKIDKRKWWQKLFNV